MNDEFMFLTEGELREIIHIVIAATSFSRRKSSRRIKNLTDAAPEMYALIEDLARTEQPGNYVSRFLDLKERAQELLSRVAVSQEDDRA